MLSQKNSILRTLILSSFVVKTKYDIEKLEKFF